MDVEENHPFDAATTVEHSSEGNSEPRSLLADAELLDAMLAHLRSCLPEEGCGLLASVSSGEYDRVVHFFPGTNIDRSPVRYTMDPREVIDAMVRMRAEGWNLGAIVHSHPRTAPIPSRTDLNEWYYRGARLLIVSFETIEPEIQCWALTKELEREPFQPVPLLTRPAIADPPGRVFPVSLTDGIHRLGGILRTVLNRFR